MTDKLGYELYTGDVITYPGDAVAKYHGVIHGDVVYLYHKGQKQMEIPSSLVENRYIKMNAEPIVESVIVLPPLVNSSPVQRSVEFLSEECDSCSA